jgi:hypothetical protein
MFLFTDPTLEEFTTKGQTVQEQLSKIKGAFDKGIQLTNLQKSLVAIDNEAKKLSRTLGSGVVMNSNTFRDSLFQIQQNVGDLNIGFDGVIEAVQSVADTTGKMTLPTEKVTTQMLEIGKAAGIGNKEIGIMVGTFMAFTKGQQTAVKEMAKISKIARETGLNATKLLTSISADLGKLDKYNFKKGTDGLTSMAAEAQRLGTTISDIGIYSIADSLVDPEKAIEAAANMSMLGTSVDGLTNPFQLLNDSANNVENLQSKMIELAKSAFKIDEATGAIETNFVSQQKLKAQTEALGADYDKFLQLGRAAAKEQLVTNKLISSGLKLTDISEEQLNLVKSLAEIGPGGKIELNLPNFNTNDLAKELEDNPTKIKDALTKYQAEAALSDRDLAIKGLNLDEQISKDTRIIRDAALKQLTSADRTEIMKDMEKGAKDSAELTKTASKELATVTVNAAKGLSSVYGNYMTNFTTFKPSDVTLEEKQRLENVGAEEVGKTGSDMLFGADNIKTLSLGKGEIFNFIKEDEAIFAPNAIENLGVLKDVYMQTMGIAKSIPSEVKLIEPASTKTGEISKQIVETNTNVVTTNKNEDTINLNINLNIDGRNLPNNLSDMLFKNPSTVRELENKVMDVLDKQDILRRSKGRFIKR